MSIDNLDFILQQTIPQVYDNTMSYYELLNAVVSKLNSVINTTNAFGDDMQGYVDAQLTAWQNDGTLGTLINQTLQTDIGDITKLSTNDKSSTVNAINEVNGRVDDTMAHATILGLHNYPKQTGETDDTARITRALNDLYNNGGGFLLLPHSSELTISANIKINPLNGTIKILGGYNTIINVATDSTTYGITVGESTYNTKTSNLSKYVAIDGIKFVASGSPKGGIYVEPGAFFPTLTNLRFKDFIGDGACIYTYNDGFNNPTTNTYSWVDNATYENIVCENVKNGIWFVGNEDHSTDAGQSAVENTFSQTKLKNIYVQVSQTGGQSYHFEGSFARSEFEGLISFFTGNALTDANTNKSSATTYHYFLKGDFTGTTFESLGAEGGGYVIKLDPSMLPDSYGDNTLLDTLGQWIGCGWLNIPDTTRKLLKIVDPPQKQSHVNIDSINSITTYRRDNQPYSEVTGILNFVGDTTVNSGYQTITVTLPTPMLELFDIQCTIGLDKVDTTANKALYGARVDSYGVDSIGTVSKTNSVDSTSYTKYTTVTFFVKVNTNTSQGVTLRYSIRGRIPGKWDYYYGIS